MSIQVRYSECDPMGVAHHAAYAVWFEMGRTEMLRSRGVAYRDMEAEGVFLVVVRLDIRYRNPVRYDDVLTLETTLEKGGPVKIEHSYVLLRGDEAMATAQTTLACVDRQGQVTRVPDSIASS
jgi:acyl-CoA thioester hydrolase